MRNAEARHKTKAAVAPVDLITISQLWIWKVEDAYIVSNSFDLRVSNGRFQYRNGGLGYNTFLLFTDAYKFVGTLMSQVLEYLGDPTKADAPYQDLDQVYSSRERPATSCSDIASTTSFQPVSVTKPIFNEFEKAITHASELVNTYLEDVTVENISIEKEKGFVHDISDIRDELAMIKRVVFQQEEVWKDFAFNAWPEHWPTGQDGRMLVPRENLKWEEGEKWREVLHAQTLFGKYRRRIDQLNEDAERVERAITTKLEMMAKHASLKESHTQRRS